MRKLTLPLLLIPAAIVMMFYQNCSRFDSNSTGLSSAASDGGASAVNPGAPAPAPSPLPDVIKPIWSDEFDGLSLYDASTKTGNWRGASLNQTESGVGWGAEYDISPADTSYGVTPVTVQNGMLNIRTDRAPAALQAMLNGAKYTSGAIRTVNPSFGYAYYEMRAQLPKGSGLWAAFWLLPADGGWPPEIDIVESLGNSPSTMYSTVHSGKNFDNAVTYSTGHWQSGKDVATGVDTTAGFHTYGCDFRADFITWYFDGKEVFKSPTPSDLVDRKVYIVLDTALGGWNNNDVTASTVFPADYTIDYVRVYAQIP